MDQTFEKRKKVIYDFICDDFYVPMKIKEIAMVLQITKEQRKELQEVLDSLPSVESTARVRRKESWEHSKRTSVDLDLLW